MIWKVAIAGLITAVFTGFGAVPFVFMRKISEKWLGSFNAIAGGLMLGASVELIIEGQKFSLWKAGVGVLMGALLIHVIQKHIHLDKESTLGSLKGLDARKGMLIIGIMTIHSFAEGIGVGVSFGGDDLDLGYFISGAIAFHNIPEGLAISLLLVPKGMKVGKAALWSIFSSLPQPLLAVPSYIFVETFKDFLPIGLGLAAGAMIWMVFAELVPEAREHISSSRVAFYASLALGIMLLIQYFL